MKGGASKHSVSGAQRVNTPVADETRVAANDAWQLTCVSKPEEREAYQCSGRGRRRGKKRCHACKDLERPRHMKERARRRFHRSTNPSVRRRPDRSTGRGRDLKRPRRPRPCRPGSRCHWRMDRGPATPTISTQTRGVSAPEPGRTIDRDTWAGTWSRNHSKPRHRRPGTSARFRTRRDGVDGEPFGQG